MHSKPNSLQASASDGAPLAGAGLGGQALGAGHLVEIGLGDGGVGLVAAGGADALVLVINVRGRLQGLLEAHRAQQRRGPPQRVNVAHRLRDFDPALRAHLLPHEVLGEDRQQRFRRHGLFGAGMQRRGQRFREISQQVVPGLGNVGLCQVKTCLHRQSRFNFRVLDPQKVAKALVRVTRNLANNVKNNSCHRPRPCYGAWPFRKGGAKNRTAGPEGANGLESLRRWAQRATITLKSIPCSAGWFAQRADF